MANEHTDEADCLLEFSIYLDDTVVFQETVSSDNVINWRYYKLELDTELKSGVEYELIIECPENFSGVPFKVFLSQVDNKEGEELFYNENDIEGELDLCFSYNVLPVFKIFLLMVTCIIGVLIIWFKEKFVFLRKINSVFVLLLNAVVTFYVVELLCSEDMGLLIPNAIFFNIIIIASISFVLMAIFNSSMLAGGITFGLFTLLALVNHFILDFRGTVILPSDVYSVKTAAMVAENYELTLDRNILISCVIVPAWLLVLYLTNSAAKFKLRMVNVAVAVVTSVLSIMVSTDSSIAQKYHVGIAQDMQTYRSNQIGFVFNFAQNLKYFMLPKPDNYSEKKVAEILENVEPVAVAENSEKTNIIVIMNESFTDLRYIGDFETDVEYLENFYRIAQDENAKIGKCVASVFGGGTSCSEFEFLTGCTMMFFGSGNAPYQQYIHSETNALPSLLKENVYGTYAIHQADPRSWNRHVAYPLIGFDRFISIESDEFDDATYCRYWIDDQSLFNVTEEVIDYSDNSFVFDITIQCHGGYDFEGYESTVHVENLSQPYEDVNQYLSLIRETDKAFDNFIDSIKESDKPTIVLMFGDHLPSLNDNFYTEIANGGNLGQFQKMETPYIIWANYDVDFSDMPDVISLNFMAPYLLKYAGIELDDYFNYLYSLSQEYPVVTRNGIIDKDGNMSVYSLKDKCYEMINEYEILQYYRLKSHMK